MSDTLWLLFGMTAEPWQFVTGWNKIRRRLRQAFKARIHACGGDYRYQGKNGGTLEIRPCSARQEAVIRLGLDRLGVLPTMELFGGEATAAADPFHHSL